jgi:hypothetical protein
MPLTPHPLIIQTSYAELIDQLRTAKITDFPAGTTFRKRTINNKQYWYAQQPSNNGTQPPERYVGVDTPALTQTIENAKTAKNEATDRKTIINALKAAGLPHPDATSAALLENLARAGVFRLRGVLVGKMAFQTYSGLLGIAFPGAVIRTGDLDVAGDYGISVALDDTLEKPFLEILQNADKAFAPVPSLHNPLATASYAKPGGYRVDVLTTNRGGDTDAPVHLPSLKTDALPLRHLDYLLRETVEAAVLSRYGTLVNVPAPQRFAVHKLMLAVLHSDAGGNAAKTDKDIAQAGALIEAFVLKRRGEELREAYAEAVQRGAAWQKKLESGRRQLPIHQQELLQSVLSS